MSQTEHDSIALVDLSYLWKLAWHRRVPDGKPDEAAQDCIGKLQGIRESVDHVILCLDSPPYEHRLAIDPEYKSSREPPTDAEQAQKRWLMDRIDKLGFQMARAKGFEADDVIAALAHRLAPECRDIRIVASDKDLACLVGENVRMFVPPVGGRDGEVRGPDEVLAKYGVAPESMQLLLALCGDKTDDVPGIPGIGGKKAAWLIEQYGDIKGIAKALADSTDPENDGRSDIKPAMGKALAENWDQLQRSLELVKLRLDVPLDVEALLERKEQKPLAMEDAMSADHDEEESETGGPEEVEGEPVDDTAKPADPSKYESHRPKQVERAIVRHPQYGAVDTDLQPMDLESARSIAKWAHEGQLYPQFRSPQAIFTILSRGRELGLGWTTALAGFHLIEGKPSASADLIRALAERDPDFEYLMLVESDTEKATWEGKHKRHPKPTPYTYTIQEAKDAGLLRPSRNGKPSNWTVRPRDMLTKTAGSKLARLLWPKATMGLYCPEEMQEQV